MPTIILQITLIILFIFNSSAYALGNNQAKKPPVDLSPVDIAKKVIDALVIISAKNDEGKSIAIGSGFVINNGLVVTNLHVIKRAYSIELKMAKSGIIYS